MTDYMVANPKAGGLGNQRSEHSANILEIERLLRRIPQGTPELRTYVDRAKRYRHECGCSTGGAFSVVSILFAAAFWYIRPNTGMVGHLKAWIYSCAFILLAGIIGKGIGIGVAKFKLALLLRKLRREAAA